MSASSLRISEKGFSRQCEGEDHRVPDQLVLSSHIGWHQGEVLSIINLLVSTSLGSMFLWSAVFIFLYKWLRNVCQVFISFSYLPDPGMEPTSPAPSAFNADSLPTEPLSNTKFIADAIKRPRGGAASQWGWERRGQWRLLRRVPVEIDIWWVSKS